MFIHCSIILSINLQKCSMCSNTNLWISNYNQLFRLLSNKLYYRAHIYFSQWVYIHSCNTDNYNNRCNIK